MHRDLQTPAEKRVDELEAVAKQLLHACKMARSCGGCGAIWPTPIEILLRVTYATWTGSSWDGPTLSSGTSITKDRQ